jgi:hypothetical protein
MREEEEEEKEWRMFLDSLKKKATWLLNVDWTTAMGDFLLFKLLFLFLFKFEFVFSINNQNHSCFTCTEPLMGYSKIKLLLKNNIYWIIL